MKSKSLVRFTRPSKVVATLPADCVKLAALNVLEANTVAADVTVTSLRRVPPPTAPLKRMSPAEVSVRIWAPFKVAVAPPVPKSISAIVVTRVVVPVRVVFSPKNIEPAVKVPALEFKLMPEALSAESAPKIVPLATKVMVPAFTPLPPMVRLLNPLPPTAVNVPVTVIGAVANVVKSAKLVAAALAEMPLTKRVLSITTPSAPVAVSMRVPAPPPTTTESLILKNACVASALMLVEFPEPFTVKLPVPVITPSILNSPAPPCKKSTETSLLLVHAAATVTAPTLVVVLPRTTKSTDG